MEEQTIWVDRPVLRDVFLNPFWIILTAATGGLFLFVVAYLVIVRLTTRYTLTNHRLMVEKGIIAKKIDDIELYRIKDTKLDQGVIDRMLQIGSVKVNTSDVSGNWNIKKILSPRDTREKIRKATEQLKQSRNVRIHTE